MFYVYSIYNRQHQKIYIGQTTNIPKRVLTHNNKTFKTSYTAKFDGEWKLIYQEEVATCHEALKRESQLKSFRGREYLKQFIPK